LSGGSFPSEKKPKKKFEKSLKLEKMERSEQIFSDTNDIFCQQAGGRESGKGGSRPTEEDAVWAAKEITAGKGVRWRIKEGGGSCVEKKSSGGGGKGR